MCIPSTRNISEQLCPIISLEFLDGSFIKSKRKTGPELSPLDFISFFQDEVFGFMNVALIHINLHVFFSFIGVLTLFIYISVVFDRNNNIAKKTISCSTQ